MKKNNFSWRWKTIAFVAFAFLLANCDASATGYYFHLKDPNFAYKQNGTTKISQTTDTNNVVQIITGDRTTPLTGGGLSTGQVSVFQGKIGEGTGNDGEFEKFYGVGNSQPIFLRIWPAGIGNGKTYGETAQLYTSAAGDNANETLVSSITCNMKLSAPPPITCTVGSYVLSYNASSAQYLPSFVVSPTNLTTNSLGEGNYLADTDGTKVKYNSISYEITKSNADGSNADWANKKTFTSGTVVEANAAAPFFIKGGSYSVRGTATNNIGTGTTGTAYPFTIPSGADGTGGTVKFTYSLKTYAPYAPGTAMQNINNIAVPYKTDAFSLLASIDAQATAQISYAVCKFNSATTAGAIGPIKQYDYFPFGDAATSTKNFTISTGEAVQVFVSRDAVVTFEGVTQ